jgi:hypothetical protein
MNFKLIFHLDGRGVSFNPREPIHLDALLTWCLAPMQCNERHITRDDDPEDIRLPLLRTKVKGIEVWRASALFPDGPQFEGLQWWRKRFRDARADLSAGSPNCGSGVYRDWSHPIPLVLCNTIVAFASGNRSECRKLLRKQLRCLGKKRAYGLGKIVEIEAVETPEDYSLVRDGRAMRWLPNGQGPRLVRARPPYWNRIDRVMCCEVGDSI